MLFNRLIVAGKDRELFPQQRGQRFGKVTREIPFKYNQGSNVSILLVRRKYGGKIAEVKRIRSSADSGFRSRGPRCPHWYLPEAGLNFPLSVVPVPDYSLATLIVRSALGIVLKIVRSPPLTPPLAVTGLPSGGYRLSDHQILAFLMRLHYPWSWWCYPFIF